MAHISQQPPVIVQTYADSVGVSTGVFRWPNGEWFDDGNIEAVKTAVEAGGNNNTVNRLATERLREKAAPGANQRIADYIGPWKCNFCQYTNQPQVSKCGMCDTPMSYLRGGRRKRRTRRRRRKRRTRRRRRKRKRRHIRRRRTRKQKK